VPRRRCIINPNNGFRRTWDFALAVLLVLVAAVVPWRAVYDDASEQDLDVAFVVTTLLVFLGDRLLNFRTAYVSSGRLIFSSNMIATHYLRAWFLVDFISTLPFPFVQYLVVGGQAGTACDGSNASYSYVDTPGAEVPCGFAFRGNRRNEMPEMVAILANWSRFPKVARLVQLPYMLRILGSCTCSCMKSDARSP
jgi:hypothetical protein